MSVLLHKIASLMLKNQFFFLFSYQNVCTLNFACQYLVRSFHHSYLSLVMFLNWIGLIFFPRRFQMSKRIQMDVGNFSKGKKREYIFVSKDKKISQILFVFLFYEQTRRIISNQSCLKGKNVGKELTNCCVSYESLLIFQHRINS